MTGAKPQAKSGELSGQLAGDEQTVFDVLLDLYSCYLDNDRDRLEAHLAQDCTLFDSSAPELMSKAELQAARRTAPVSDGPVSDAPAAPRPVALDASEPQVRVWDGWAVETHRLDAHFDDASLDQRLRCSSMLRMVDGRWLIEHHHEELLRD
jgi:hypothetical protein